MTQTINLTSSGGSLGLEPAWRASPLVIRGTVTNPALSVWRAQLWRRPQDVRAEDSAPLATTYGTVAEGVMSAAFTAAQMDVDLVADHGAYDDLWLVVGGTGTDGQAYVVVADWLRVREGGFDADAYTVTPITFTVEDDMLSFSYGGTTYTRPVEEVDIPPGTSSGDLTWIDDMIVLTTNTTAFTWPVEETEEPTGAVLGGGVVIDDELITTVEGGSFKTPVTPTQ